MILADTSVWIDHLRGGDAALARLLECGAVCVHPFVIGEIALGHLRQRAQILGLLKALPGIAMAKPEECLLFIERLEVFGRGIGYVDAHLLASLRLQATARLWTRDKRLHDVADSLKLAA